MEKMKYRCLWCDATEQQPPQHDALKLYYQPVDEQSNWFYEICGVCESCCRLEWEEYRNDHREQRSERMREEVEKRFWANIELELKTRKQRADAKKGISGAVRLEFGGTGGKDKDIRRLRKIYWSTRAPPCNYW